MTVQVLTLNTISKSRLFSNHALVTFAQVFEEATNAESFDGQQGMIVPYNSPKCRSLKSEGQISTFDQGTTEF